MFGGGKTLPTKNTTYCEAVGSVFCLEEVTDARLKTGLRLEFWFNLYSRVFISHLTEKKPDINECLALCGRPSTTLSVSWLPCLQTGSLIDF